MEIRVELLGPFFLTILLSISLKCYTFHHHHSQHNCNHKSNKPPPPSQPPKPTNLPKITTTKTTCTTSIINNATTTTDKYRTRQLVKHAKDAVPWISLYYYYNHHHHHHHHCQTQHQNTDILKIIKIIKDRMKELMVLLEVFSQVKLMVIISIYWDIPLQI